MFLQPPLTGGEGGTRNGEDCRSQGRGGAGVGLEHGLFQEPWGLPVERAHGPSPGSPRVRGSHSAGVTRVGQPQLPRGPAAPGGLSLPLGPESILIHYYAPEDTPVTNGSE